MTPATLTQLPPGPGTPGPLQSLRYTFDQPGSFAALRKRFGPTFTVRLAGFPPTVVTADREAIRELFTGDPLTKHHGNDLLRPFLGDHSLLMLEPAEHLARRRLELPSFHGESIRNYSDRISELAAEEVASWAQGEVVRVHPRARKLTLTVILELVLGVHDPKLAAEITRRFDSLNTKATNLAQFMPPWITARSWWNLPARAAYAQIDGVRRLFEAHVASTRADPELEQRRDVLALLVQARDEDGEGLADHELRDELMTLIAAGHETTATAIAWAADLLAHNPEVADQLRARLAEGDREYLKAAAKEVLRARTVIYASAARHSLQPLRVGEWVVGPDALVLVDAQGIHADPGLYPEPDQFRPERFLGEQPDGYSYVPFGGGAHRCLGAALAMMELELVIEAIVSRVRLEPDGAPAGMVRRGITLAPANEAKVRVAALAAPAPA